MWSRVTRQLIEAACEEDLGAAGDITSALMPDAAVDVMARVIVREEGVICGLDLGPVICDVFSRRLGRPLSFEQASVDDQSLEDGSSVQRGACVAHLRGRHAAVLSVERTLLNFLGRMSGVATLTRRFVEAARLRNPNVKILDTRKTIPGWRELDKYAVRTGGGKNHRFGLYDAILIKDNHLADVPTERLADELARRLRGGLPSAASELDAWPTSSTVNSEGVGPAGVAAPAFVEVEVDTLEQLREVCEFPGVDIVLLDNFSLDALREAVALRDSEDLRGKLQLEASGGVTLENVADIAATGVDRISVGALTHSAACLDIGLDL